MTDRPTMTAAEVATALGLSLAGYRRRAAQLRQAHGFPAPLPGLRCYSRAAVLGWIAAGGAHAAASDDPADILVARARAMAAA